MKLLNTLKERKWDYLINFFVMLIGIWVGFYLANLSDQERKNEATLNNLGYLYTECADNFATAKGIYSQLINRGLLQPLAPSLERYSILSLVADANLNNIVDLELYSLLLSYSKLTGFINRSITVYNNIFLNNDFANTDKLQMRHFLINRTAKFIAINYDLRDQLRDKGFYQRTTIDIDYEINSRINGITNYILNGEFTLTHPDGTIDTLPRYNGNIIE